MEIARNRDKGRQPRSVDNRKKVENVCFDYFKGRFFNCCLLCIIMNIHHVQCSLGELRSENALVYATHQIVSEIETSE